MTSSYSHIRGTSVAAQVFACTVACGARGELTTGREDKVAKEDRGFASMDRNKQREIASKGGKAAHQKGTAHEWTSEEAREAGRKGGMASHRRKQQQPQPNDQSTMGNPSSNDEIAAERSDEGMMENDHDLAG
jgi:general stress protein YciG